MKLKISIVTAAMALAMMSGCQTRLQSLQSVAKDWCETIRASQIIPVYPLTEDLQPGDVFLVQMSTARQAELYRNRGFLPLDDHRTRLKFDQDAYRKLYFESYWSDDFGGELPHTRPARPITPKPGEESDTPVLTEAGAPRVAFPTYSFEVSTSGGLGLALPLKGVPTGFGFLNAKRATGSVTIADARTYGVDARTAHETMVDWASDPQIRAQLASAVKQNGGEPLYIRVVTRVYLTGAMNVTLTRSDSVGADLSAGAAPDVNLVKPGGDVNGNYDQVLSKLNSTPESGPSDDLPKAGGRVKFVGASSTSVSMVESFDRLLVVGYVGLDVPVFTGGVLGYPVPTFQRLEGLTDAPAQPALAITSAELGIKARLRLVTGGVLKRAGSDSLTDMAVGERRKAARVMASVLKALPEPDPSDTHAGASAKVAVYLAGSFADAPNERVAFADAAEAFRTWSLAFITGDGAAEPLDARFASAFDAAFGREFEGLAQE